MARRRRDITLRDLGAEVCIHETNYFDESNVKRCSLCGAVWDARTKSFVGGSIDNPIHPAWQDNARRVAPAFSRERAPFEPSPVLPEASDGE